MKEVIQLLQSLPPGTIAALVKLIRAVVGSDDPQRTAERAAAVIASKAGAEAALRKALG